MVRFGKKSLKFVALAAAGGILGIAAQAQAQLATSAHDLTTVLGETNICAPCHTPHDSTVASAPLWSRTLSGATLTPYGDPNGTMDGAPVAPTAGSASYLCLSCHDGTVAIDSYDGNPTNAVGVISTIDPTADKGIDLSDDHPVVFDYTDTVANNDGELFTPSDTNSGLGGFIADDLLQNDSLECSSCHDVHNTNTAEDPLLLISQADLCGTCHDK